MSYTNYEWDKNASHWSDYSFWASLISVAALAALLALVVIFGRGA